MAEALPPSTASLWIGLMSGTSLDGVDAVLVRIDDTDTSQAPRLDTLGHVQRSLDPLLRRELLALNVRGTDDLHRAMVAANGVSRAYAEAVKDLLVQTGVAAQEIGALGAHGQTVRHQPGAFDGVGYTLQLLNAPLLAEWSGIDVVHDFRSRDLAAGGQGAPLVPACHAALFARPDVTTIVVNVGGMANLTLLPPTDSGQPVSGWDTGPGNVLMDAWIQRHQGLPYDAGGNWAASGQPDAHRLDALKRHAEAFFDQAPPKSTGRETFDLAWLDEVLSQVAHEPGGPNKDPAHIQATLCELTAWSVGREIRRAIDKLRAEGVSATLAPVLVCGGGAFNHHLMKRLAQQLADLGLSAPVKSTSAQGVPPDQVEALAFAWLAWRFVRGEPGNLPAVTGASGLRRLGSWTPAR